MADEDDSMECENQGDSSPSSDNLQVMQIESSDQGMQHNAFRNGQPSLRSSDNYLSDNPQVMQIVSFLSTDQGMQNNLIPNDQVSNSSVVTTQPASITGQDPVLSKTESQPDIYRDAEELAALKTPLDDTKHQNISVSPDPRSSPHRSFSKDSHTADEKRPTASAPQDIAKFRVKVDWQESLPVKKMKMSLEKALQAWCNIHLSKVVGKKCNVNSLELMTDPIFAEVQISPSEALNVLKNMKTVPLKFKGQIKDVTCWILLDETDSLPVAQNSIYTLDKKEVPLSKELNTPPAIRAVSSANAEANNDKDIAVKRAPNRAENSTVDALTVPLYQYWYMHHAYRNELEKIEKEHGVTFSAEVSVSFRPTHHANSDSMSKASENFQKLLQECLEKFSYATFDHTHMDSDTMKEIQRNIQSEEQRMMLSISASNGLFLGPTKITGMIKRKLGLVEGAEAARLESQFKDKSSKMQIGDSVFQQNWTSLDMDTKDIPTQLEMDKVHWDLIKTSYYGQLAQLEKKYGVSFHPEEHQNNLTIKVRAQSKIGQHTNLETHALIALIQLYQKLATATVTCELKISKDANAVAPIVEKLQSQHYCVIAVDVYGPWRLVGLPEHLGPAIAEIEKTLQKKVFDEKMKKLIGYSSDIPHLSGIKWDNTLSLGQEAVGGINLGVKDDSDTGFNGESGERAKENSTTDSKGAHGKEEQCPICMDSFTNEKQLKCGHKFCSECIKKAVESMGSICPVCKQVFGKMEGNQPYATMKFKKHRYNLPGYPNSGTIEISYDIPSGTQTSKHPNPGQRYIGTYRSAYLPDNTEGNEVLKLLQRAFDQKLIFTVGTSTTSGAMNTVTWNDIHHKTNTHGGPEGYGYPDPNYLKRVKDELKAKGIE